ncbi:MAG: CapA family protein [Halobacteriales archaeon]|nr:CapA family protein [Halobacteriales archaeon]
MSTNEASIRIAAAGDAMITRKVSTFDHERFDQLVETVRGADASMINLEVLLHDYEGYPAANGPGTYMRAPPWTADELTWCGFDIFAAATNHTFDYSHGGMEATMRELEDRNIPYAGLGRTLATAREPAYVDTPSGRVALVAVCSTITTGSVAGAQRPDLQGRPGLAPLRWDTRYVVPEDRYEQLQAISEGLGLEALKRQMAELGFPLTDPDEEIFRFLNVGSGGHPGIEIGDEYRVYREPREADVEAVTTALDRAQRQADWVIASLHAHEGAGPRSTDQTNAPFIEEFARTCIDAGADMFAGHGSHTVRGIELYDEKPIFYSLGNFIAQNETVTRLPAEMYDQYGLDQDSSPADIYDWRLTAEDGSPSGFLADSMYWESILPVCEFADGSLDHVKIYPLDLLHTEPRPRRGRPIIATGDTAASVFADLKALSDPYGTSIDVEDGVGIIEP